MDEKNKIDRLKDVEDEMLGKYLSMEVNKENPKTACPSEEHFAAFIDGNLNGEDRDALMGHLSSCDDCYELYTEVISMQEEMAKDSWLSSKVIKFIPYPLAAAAAILIMLFVFRDSYVEDLSFVKERVAMLAADIDTESFSYGRSDGSTYDYSFTDTTTLTSKSFRVGISLTDIELATTAEDKESTSVLLNNIIASLKSMNVSSESILIYDDMNKEIEEGGSLKQISDRIDKAMFINLRDYLFVRFGQWCEGGRIAAVTGTGKFYHIDDIRFFIRKLEKEGLPVGVNKSLQEIEKIVKENVYTEKQFSRLEKEYENLILLH